MSTVSLISVPFFMGRPMAGFTVPEPHEVLSPLLPEAGPLHRMGVLYRCLAQRVATAERPVSFAGDCLSAIGMLAGLERRDVRPTLIWFDAHGDFNTPQTSPSGFPGGMPLAMITGRGDQTVMEAVGLSPLPDDRVILADGRHLDPGEAAAVAASGVTHTAASMVGAVIPSSGPLHVHLDTDVVNPVDMPAMNYPAAGGPSLAVMCATLADLADTGRVVALSVSSWNPALPGADVAAAAVHEMVTPFLA